MPLNLTSIQVTDARTIEALYTVPPSSVDALNPSNYMITPALDVLGVAKVTDYHYKVTTSRQTPGTDYALKTGPCPPVLAVSSVSLSSGSAAGGEAVTITGLGFVAPATVEFGVTPATSVVVVGDTTITCVTPAHSAGAVDVRVTTDCDSKVKLNGYTFNAAPCTPDFTPNSNFEDFFASLANWTTNNAGNAGTVVASADPSHASAYLLSTNATSVGITYLFDGGVGVSISQNFLVCTHFRVIAPIPSAPANSFIVGVTNNTLSKFVVVQDGPGGHFSLVWQNGGAQTVTESTVTVDSLWHDWEIQRNGGTVTLRMDGTIIASHATDGNYPSGTSMSPIIGAVNLAGNVLSSLKFDYYRFQWFAPPV